MLHGMIMTFDFGKKRDEIMAGNGYTTTSRKKIPGISYGEQ